MKKKAWINLVLAFVCVAMLAGCGEITYVENSGMGNVENTAQPESTKAPVTNVETAITVLEDTQDDTLGEVKIFSFTPEEIQVTTKRFFSETVKLVIDFPEGAQVFYTTDGSEPNTNAKEYSEPIELKAATGNFPNSIVLKVKAYYPGGLRSEVITHTFFAQEGIENRFETVIFAVSGEPKHLTYETTGIFHGDNAKQRGRESEREIYLEVIDSTGELILEQKAGARPYGGASRESSMKSMKLFARKEYDEDHGKFALDIFGTVGADGKVMDKYDKLVLRNYGNDFQFAFIRDELNQRLAAQAGYTNVEAVVPAVVYLNGKYYGLHYLHENYCDDFFKDKYGDGAGKYEVIEGGERYKSIDETDEQNAQAAKDYKSGYNNLAYGDLTNEEAYAKLCAFMDVENYLDYYAYNIYINNNDWPQNNYKCYRYYAAEGEKYGFDEMDGRWRFLLHDMDFSMGLYGSRETDASYNNLKEILNEESERYSPLFTALMEREDCREYFIEAIGEVMNGPLWSVNVERTLEEMSAERANEMVYFFEHLEDMKKYDKSIWIWYDEYLKRTENIKKFAKDRKAYMVKYLQDAFGEVE